MSKLYAPHRLIKEQQIHQGSEVKSCTRTQNSSTSHTVHLIPPILIPIHPHKNDSHHCCYRWYYLNTKLMCCFTLSWEWNSNEVANGLFFPSGHTAITALHLHFRICYRSVWESQNICFHSQRIHMGHGNRVEIMSSTADMHLPLCFLMCCVMCRWRRGRKWGRWRGRLH